MVIHLDESPRDHPPQYVAPKIAMGALIAEAGDPCVRCLECREMFLITIDGYHPHLYDEEGKPLLANDQYRDIDGGVLYDWMPVTDCPNCHKSLAKTASATYGWGDAVPSVFIF